MKRVVLHASAFADWFSEDDLTGLRLEFEEGHLEVVVPRSLVVDTMAILAARGWSADRIERAGSEFPRLGFTVIDAPSAELAFWLVRGLSASAAGYAALASWLNIPIAVTDPDVKLVLRTLPQL